MVSVFCDDRRRRWRKIKVVVETNPNDVGSRRLKLRQRRRRGKEMMATMRCLSNLTDADPIQSDSVI
jgi:hypothetical protein